VRGFRDEYVSALRRACDDLVAHGVQLRRDATAPFTRLVVAQTEALEALRRDLSEHQQALVAIQRGLAEMDTGKRRAVPLEESVQDV